MSLCAQCGTPAFDGVAGCPVCGSLLRTDDPAQVGAGGGEVDADFEDVGGRLDDAALQKSARVGFRYLECTADGGVRCRHVMGTPGGNFVAWGFLLLFGLFIAFLNLILFGIFLLIVLGVIALGWPNNVRPVVSVLYPDGRFVRPSAALKRPRPVALGLPLQFDLEYTGLTLRGGLRVHELHIAGPLRRETLARGGEADMRALWREYLLRFDALAQLAKTAQHR